MQRKREREIPSFQQFICFSTLSHSPAWREMTAIPTPRITTVQWKSRLTPQRCKWHCSLLLLKWISRAWGFALKSRIMLSLFWSHVIYSKAIFFPRFTAIHTYAIRNITCHILSLPGYKSPMCWCWCEVRMLNASQNQALSKRQTWCFDE